MTWTAKTEEALAASLDPKHVKKPEGKFGPKGDYLEGWHVIAQANEVFGHNGWGYEIKSLTQDRLDVVPKDGGQQYQAAYTCIVILRVDGSMPREDVGFGSGFAKSVGDAIEGATKEAVTDALKRALRTYGWRFGLALYDKTREHVQAPPVQRDPDQVRDSLVKVVSAAADADALNKAIGGQKFDAAWQWLAENHEDHSLAVRRAVDAARAKFEAPEEIPY